MATKEQIAGNKIIAKYDGWKLRKEPFMNSDEETFPWWEKFDHNGKVIRTEHYNILESQIDGEYGSYHNSWSWLMPVLEKIQKEGKCTICDGEDGYGIYTQVQIFGHGGSFKMFYWHDYERLEKDIAESGPASFRFIVSSKKEALWLAVLEYVTWYSKIKPSKSK